MGRRVRFESGVKCKNCKYLFHPKNIYNDFCCSDCRERWHKNEYIQKRYEEHPPIEKTCKHCKKTFKTIYYKQSFCSDLCSREANIVKLNEKWAKKVPKKRKYQNLKMQMFHELRDKPSDAFLKKFKACRG